MKNIVKAADDILTDIKNVCLKQKTAVLATMGEDGPYQSLVAFALLPGLKEIVFATDKNTTKYKNLRNTREVSLLIDNRTDKLNDFKNIIVVTAVGEAFEVEGAFEDGPGKEYMECHPLLGEKFLTESSALINIKIKKYIVVSKFSEVREYYP
jgi:uncharacterized pyridoxamine 5'-phosphate oxidase family protein